MTWQGLVRWQKTKWGLLSLVVVQFLLAYGFASMAIDRGNLWWYLIGFILIISGVHNTIRLIRKFFS